jgi:hypothetical protein
MGEKGGVNFLLNFTIRQLPPILVSTAGIMTISLRMAMYLLSSAEIWLKV